MKAIIIGGTTTLVPNAGECPDCYEALDGATGQDGQRPKPGCFSVCALCGCLLRYTKDMSLRRLTEDDLELLTPAQRDLLHECQRMVRAAVARARQGGDVVAVQLPTKLIP